MNSRYNFWKNFLSNLRKNAWGVVPEEFLQLLVEQLSGSVSEGVFEKEYYGTSGRIPQGTSERISGANSARVHEAPSGTLLGTSSETSGGILSRSPRIM